MPDQVLKERADALLALHRPGNPVILPTVWDAWSARLAVDEGFAALTVGSHPLADSVGKPDGEGMAFDDVVSRVKQITAAVDVPVSVDLESGYAQTPARLIDGLLEAGAVGFNIEDTVHSENKRLRSVAEHAELVGALREAADRTGVHVVINARTDLFLRQDGDESDRVDRAIVRLSEAAGAGADVLYPVGRHEPAPQRGHRAIQPFLRTAKTCCQRCSANVQPFKGHCFGALRCTSNARCDWAISNTCA